MSAEVDWNLPERLRTEDQGADLADELRTAATHAREEAQADDAEKEMSERTRQIYDRAGLLDEAAEVVEWAGDRVEDRSLTQPEDTHLSGDGERLRKIAACCRLLANARDRDGQPETAKRWRDDAAFLRDLATRLSPENSAGNDEKAIQAAANIIARALRHRAEQIADGSMGSVQTQTPNEIAEEVLRAIRPLIRQTSAPSPERDEALLRAEIDGLERLADDYMGGDPKQVLLASLARLRELCAPEPLSPENSSGVEEGLAQSEHHEIAAREVLEAERRTRVLLRAGLDRELKRLEDEDEGLAAEAADQDVPVGERLAFTRALVMDTFDKAYQPVSPQPDPTTRLSGEQERVEGELEDLIRRAYCKPIKPPVEGENPETVDSMAAAALVSDPDRMRHLAGIQTAVIKAVRKLIDWDTRLSIEGGEDGLRERLMLSLDEARAITELNAGTPTQGQEQLALAALGRLASATTQKPQDEEER